MKAAVWGTGAIGGLAGAGMAGAGEDVLLVDIVPEHVAAMNQRGLTVESAAGEQCVAVRAALPGQVSGTFDIVFLAVKSQFTRAAVAAIEPHLHENSAVVSLQNGVNEPLIAQQIGAARTIGCLVDVSSDYIGPGRIRRGRAGNLFVGEMDGRMSPRLAEVQRLLALSTATHTCSNIMGYVWAKICKGTLDAMTALVDTDALELRFNRDYHPVRMQLLKEAIEVAEAEGVKVEPFAHFDPAPFVDSTAAGREAALRVLDDLARGQAAGNTRVRTGYWRDIVVRKRRTEIDYVTGEIVRRGEQHGVPTPLNSMQLQMFEEIETGRRGMGWDNLAELQAELARVVRS